jgi:NAD(P)-dependent dehydrogenase (short-subunit alcohol dehydrogenase family)
LYATLAALPHMHGGARRIVNISSIGGRVAVPHLLPYCASKFALTGLSEGLRSELARDGFAVTTVCPGLMRTGSTYNAEFKGRHAHEFAWFHLSGAMPAVSIAADRAARQIIDACRHGDAGLVLTPAARAALLMNAVAPGAMRLAMALANAMLPGPAGGNGESRSGWNSMSRFVPSPLTMLADRATARNNEIPGSGRPVPPGPAAPEPAA